jgi:EAL domain-containing protein (putative c-di-GMP-specific phosphodiesterase class I)
MVRAINEAGHIMGKKTIAEFVENEEIFTLLNELGVGLRKAIGSESRCRLMSLR